MKIAFLGDVALVGQFNDPIDMDKKVGYLKFLVDECDFVVANLESPITTIKKTWIPKSMHLRTNPENIAFLKYIGIDAVTLANNHSNDYGRKGLDETVRCLDNAGIKYYGIDGVSICETIKGEKISLSGFCCLSTNGMGYRNGKGKGINTLTRQALENQINSDRKNAATSIISVHFGIEHTNYPSLEHISLFNHISDKNELIVHGHHPHQIQGVIKKGKSLIAYSLGNAVFDRTTSLNGSFSVEMNEDNRKSFVLVVEIKNGKIIGYETKGFYIEDGGIKPYDLTLEIENINEVIDGIEDNETYNNLRKKQYQNGINQKFGNRDLKWLVSRMNYYSIGAKILSKIYKKMYEKVKSAF